MTLTGVDIIILGMAMMTTTATETQEDTMIHNLMPNAVQTDRTYASFKNAVNALEVAVTKTSHDIGDVRWMIAVADDGRFAPVVIGANDRAGLSNMDFIHIGVTVVG